MSSTFYRVSGSTANGTITSPDMSAQYERGYISILFYTDSTMSTLATPSAGTITFTASESDSNYGSVSSGVVDLTQQSYARPNFAGAIKKVKATCSGVTGAGYFVAKISRFGG